MAHGMLITEALVLINLKGLRVMFEDGCFLPIAVSHKTCLNRQLILSFFETEC
jgi:hypothetical protein